MSFGTYFNGFPASYWRRWSVVSEVRLTVARRRPGRQRDGLQVDGQRPLPARRRRDRRRRRRPGGHLRVRPDADAVRRRRLVLVRRRGRRRGRPRRVGRVDRRGARRPRSSTAPSTSSSPRSNKPDFCAKLLTQIGEDELLRPYLDTVFVSEQGTQKVADHELFPLAEKALGDLLVVNEQGNLGGSGGYARGQLESRPQGHRDLRDDDGRRRRLRARGHRPGRHVRRPGPPPDHRRRPHVLPLLPLAPALVRRDRAAVAVLVADAARRLLRLGPRRPQHPLRAVAAQARRRRLQRLVHVPDPAGRCSSGSACRCRSSSSGTTWSSACAPSSTASRR